MRSRALIRGLAAVLFGLVLGTPAFAETDAQRKARLELEKELGLMVEKPPTRVKLLFVGLEDPNYRIEEAAFELDGTTLKAPPAATLSDEGEHAIFAGDIAPGRHVVKARLTVANGASVVFSDEGGFKWKLVGEVSFDVFSGIEVQVRVTPSRDGNQREVGRRFKLHLPAKPVMLARLDDGAMPEPVVAKKPPVPELVDAGAPVLVAVAELPRPEPKVEPPPMPPLEKEPAAQVRRPGKPREAPAVAASPPQPEPVAVVVDAGAAEPVAVAVVDAGAPVVVAAPVDAGAPSVAALPPPPEEDGSKTLGWILFGAGAALVAFGLLFLGRRNPKLPED